MYVKIHEYFMKPKINKYYTILWDKSDNYASIDLLVMEFKINETILISFVCLFKVNN